jgi:hypothetical protein
MAEKSLRLCTRKRVKRRSTYPTIISDTSFINVYQYEEGGSTCQQNACGNISTEREAELIFVLGISEINAFIVGTTNAEAAGALSLYIHQVSDHHIINQPYRAPVILQGKEFIHRIEEVGTRASPAES